MGANPGLPLPRLPRTVRRFIATESSGGIVLLAATVVALVWANSPWQGGYEALWSTPAEVAIGRFVLGEELRAWVNDGLMALFFFVVGLEIKREFVRGDLRDPRRAAIPVLAAVGGMVVPAAVYLAFNVGGDHVAGWGIPMATDIAFALGVLALLGPRVPESLKVFLLTLAIVDDIGAILVIAIVYGKGVQVGPGLAALALLLVIAVLARARVTWFPLYLVLGTLVWLCTHASGVHATIAGVALALLTPARPLAPAAVVREWAESLEDEPSPSDMTTMSALARASVSTAERLQHALHPWTSFLIVPVFALANAGIHITTDAFAVPGAAGVAGGIVLGLIGGKLLGILGATWLGVRTGLGRLPDGTTWPHLAGVATLAGIGFTVSLFITPLAFPADPEVADVAKLAILVASTAAAALGTLSLLRTTPSEPSSNQGADG